MSVMLGCSNTGRAFGQQPATSPSSAATFSRQQRPLQVSTRHSRRVRGWDPATRSILQYALPAKRILDICTRSSNSIAANCPSPCGCTLMVRRPKAHVHHRDSEEAQGLAAIGIASSLLIITDGISTSEGKNMTAMKNALVHGK